MHARNTFLLITFALLAACSRRNTAPSPPSHEEQAPLDGRTPLPLLLVMAQHQKQQMRDHLVAVQEVVLAVAQDDFAGVARAAARLGYSEQMGQMCSHMGAGAEGFTERALEFHHRADSISDAAKRGDRPAVMRALASTLQSCTACHATFRQSIVGQDEWARATTHATKAH